MDEFSRKFACGCSLDDGPCEKHATVVVVREGASLRTPDELALQFIEDIQALGSELPLAPWGEFIIQDARDAIMHGTMDQELSYQLNLLADKIEVEASFNGYFVVFNDGYVVLKVHDDCPLS